LIASPWNARRIRKGYLMKPAIKKSAVGRTMRVATLFTGAAACATAFAPTAMAGTAQQAHPQARFLHNSGSIQHVWSCASTPHWLHLSISSHGAISTQCWGFKGTSDVKNGQSYLTTGQCGGNNYGILITKSGHDIGYGAGTYYRRIMKYVISLENEGWYKSSLRRNDTCATNGPGF